MAGNSLNNTTTINITQTDINSDVWKLNNRVDAAKLLVMRSGGILTTNIDMETELQHSTNVHSEQVAPPDANPMLVAVLFSHGND